MDLESLILHLGALSSISAGPDQVRTIDSAASVSADIEIYVPGVIDLEKEKLRLADQLEKTGKRLEGSQKKLANENFVSRAAPEVVERERHLVEELERELTSIRENLAALEDQS